MRVLVLILTVLTIAAMIAFGVWLARLIARGLRARATRTERYNDALADIRNAVVMVTGIGSDDALLASNVLHFLNGRPTRRDGSFSHRRALDTLVGVERMAELHYHTMDSHPDGLAPRLRAMANQARR